MTAVAYLVKHIVLSTLRISYVRRSVGLSVRVVSAGLPVGAGLGSSAAFSVATAAACLQLVAKLSHHSDTCICTAEECLNAISADLFPVINEWAFAGEVLMHGKFELLLFLLFLLLIHSM
jgi:hypothetical protein